MVATAERPPKRAHVIQIPIMVRQKVRQMYLRQSLQAKEIAAACDLQEHQVRWMVSRYGWNKMRLAQEEKLSSAIQENLDPLAAEISETIAAECEEITLESLVRARQSAGASHKDAPKDFQAWTAGIRNLTTARNLARNSDKVNTFSDAAGRSVNLFFLGGVGAREIKRVDTVDDVL